MRRSDLRRRFPELVGRDAQRGSASVEFVILAIPLFLPIIVYVAHFAELSDDEISSRTLVRQVVRAYVTSNNAESAQSRAIAVFRYGATRFGFRPEDIDAMRLEFSCSQDPCLKPGANVRVTLTFHSASLQREVRVSAQEHVSPWQ